MYSSVKVKASIVEDETGIKSELPIILTEQGELSPVTDFLLHKELEGKSRSWMNRVIRATQLLMDYMEANKACFSNAQTLFQTFVKHLYTGTVGEDGFDPSGLYWIPISTDSTNQLISALTTLTDWLAYKQNTDHMNPLVEADSYIQRLNYAAWFRKNQHDFLGHIEDKRANATIRKARLVKGRKKLTRTDDDAIAFNESDFERFFKEGIGGCRDPRVALRDKLILLLMHGGGLRVSEALGLWVADVYEDPNNTESAMVRIYHPEDGKAPDSSRGRNRSTNRTTYLREHYALTPRNRLHNTQRLGWKTKVMDHKDNYIQVHWFPKDYGRFFMLLWLDYLRYLASIDRHHPYAFISFERRSLGNPYTQGAFNDSYDRGLRRIGLTSGKALGYTPHGHRHCYGRRLEKAKVSPLIIKKCMHHASLESQTVYTAPSLKEVSKRLTEATEQLENSIEHPSLDWKALVENGFEDIDPFGYFTGKQPKLTRG